MIIYRIDILVGEAFITIGYVRRDLYETKAAIEMAMTIPEMAARIANHGIDVDCTRMDASHRQGDSITSWIWRIHRW